jgi:formiminotetrahydrofolate cyclodeaminase
MKVTGRDAGGGSRAAILGVVAVAAPLIVTAIGRGKVCAPATVARLLAGRR